MFYKSKKILLVLSIILISMTVGCSKANEADQADKVEEPDREINVSSLDELYSYKLPFIKSDASIEKYIDPNQTVDKQLKLRDEVDFGLSPIYVEKLSKEEAIEDVNNYFTYLKDVYGGNEAFIPAKDSVIANIEEGMDSTGLSKLLEDALEFVVDGHFAIGKLHGMERTKSWHCVDKLEIAKDDEGYYNLSSQEYIKNIDELEAFLRPSLSSQDEACFRIIACEDDLKDAPKTVKYKDDSELHIKFSKVASLVNREIDPIYEDGWIPYLHVRSFHMPEEEEDIELILQAADEMSKAPISILDLRGNFGGDSILARQWFKEYSGEKFERSANRVLITSEESWINRKYDTQTWEEFSEDFNLEKYDDHHMIEKASSEIIGKENKLIVLTDSYSISAAEGLVDGLHHLDNTLFLGMPTAGHLDSSRFFTASLKNSKINFQFGHSWSLYDEEYYKEFYGLQPDIWMPNIDVDELIGYLGHF